MKPNPMRVAEFLPVCNVMTNGSIPSRTKLAPTPDKIAGPLIAAGQQLFLRAAEFSSTEDECCNHTNDIYLVEIVNNYL